MIILECQKNNRNFDYRQCKDCTSRECEQANLPELLHKHKEEHPDRSWRDCSICTCRRGLELFDEGPAHPGYVSFCEMWQRYLKDLKGSCDFHCLV